MYENRYFKNIHGFKTTANYYVLIFYTVLFTDLQHCYIINNFFKNITITNAFVLGITIVLVFRNLITIY